MQRREQETERATTLYHWRKENTRKRRKASSLNYDSKIKIKYVIYDNGDNYEQEANTKLDKLRKEYG